MSWNNADIEKDLIENEWNSIDIDIEFNRQLANINSYSTVWRKYSLLDIEWTKKLMALFPINSWFMWEKVCEIETEIVTEKELLKLEKRNPEIMKFAHFIGRWKYIIWVWWTWLWVRHSCNPNSSLIIEQWADWDYEMYIKSRKDIPEFNEITVDFWNRDWWLSEDEEEFLCNCWKDCRWVMNYYWESETIFNVHFDWKKNRVIKDISEWETIWFIWWRLLKNERQIQNKEDLWKTNIIWYKSNWRWYASSYKTNELAYTIVNNKKSNCYLKMNKNRLEVIASRDIEKWEDLFIRDNWQIYFKKD